MRCALHFLLASVSPYVARAAREALGAVDLEDAAQSELHEVHAHQAADAGQNASVGLALAEGTVVGNRFKLKSQLWPQPFDKLYTGHKRLGAGSFAVTFLARDLQSGEDVAVKLFTSENGNALNTHHVRNEDHKTRLDLASRECKAAQLIQEIPLDFAAGKARWMKCIYNGVDDRIAAHVVYEYLGPTNMREFVFNTEIRKKLGLRMPTEQDMMRIFKQLLEGLALVQGRFVHRDIKLDNVMMREDENGQLNAYYIDFGFVVKEGDKTALNAGSPNMMPPETDLPGYHPASSFDVYSLGNTIFELLCGFTVYEEVYELLREQHRYSRRVNYDELTFDTLLKNKVNPKMLCTGFANDGFEAMFDYAADNMIIFDAKRRRDAASMLQDRFWKGINTGDPAQKAKADQGDSVGKRARPNMEAMPAIGGEDEDSLPDLPEDGGSIEARYNAYAQEGGMFNTFYHDEDLESMEKMGQLPKPKDLVPNMNGLERALGRYGARYKQELKHLHELKMKRSPLYAKAYAEHQAEKQKQQKPKGTTLKYMGSN